MAADLHLMGGIGKRLVRALFVAGQAWCANFDLSATIRAGMINNGDWELGIGPAGNNTAFNAHLPPGGYYPNGLPNRFELGYRNATNTAFLRYYSNAVLFTEVTYSPGGGGLGAGATWTIPAGSLFVSAANRNNVFSSVRADQLVLGGGIQILQGFSSTTLYAWQNGNGGMLDTLASPVSFRTTGVGDWLLSGRIAFVGLSAYNNPGAQRSQLQLIANVSGTSSAVPEPGSVALVAFGLTGLAVLRMRSRSKGGSAR
jgi:hypothetical protein